MEKEQEFDFQKQFKQFGNPYTILEIEVEKPSYLIIKKQYKELAKKHHPDKGGDKEQFQQVQKAYKLLKHEEFKQKLDSHLENLKEMKIKYNQQDDSRKVLIEKLIREEQQAQEQFMQDKKNKMKEQMQKQEYLEKLAREKDEYEKQKKMFEQEKQNLEQSQTQSKQKLSQIMVKWSKKQQIHYSEKLLNEIFKQYGPINMIQVFEQKNSAVVEFMKIESAERAVDDHKGKSSKKDDNNSSDEDMEIQTEQQGALKVKFVVRKQKRVALLELLEKQKNQMENQHYKKQQGEEAYNITTDNLNKIQETINSKSSRAFSSLSKREQERKKMMEELKRAQQKN